MEAPVRERLLLTRIELGKNFSNITTETITRILKNIRVNHGHKAAEAKAKEIRKLIESGLSEAELLKILKQMT